MTERDVQYGTSTSLDVIDLRGRAGDADRRDDRGLAETVRETDHWDDEFTVEWAVSPRRSS